MIASAVSSAPSAGSAASRNRAAPCASFPTGRNLGIAFRRYDGVVTERSGAVADSGNAGGMTVGNKSDVTSHFRVTIVVTKAGA